MRNVVRSAKPHSMFLFNAAYYAWFISLFNVLLSCFIDHQLSISCSWRKIIKFLGTIDRPKCVLRFLCTFIALFSMLKFVKRFAIQKVHFMTSKDVIGVGSINISCFNKICLLGLDQIIVLI